MTFPRACPIADRYRWLPDTPRSDGQTFHGGNLTVSRGLVLHVTVGQGDPADWWTSPADPHVASAHFGIAKDGTLTQYVGADKVAWAEVDGNGEWHSVETVGMPGEPLTDAQLSTLGRLYAWGRATFGWALQVTDDPKGYGLGTHQMGGAAWGGHACPGPIRAGQRAQVIALAAGNPTPPHDVPAPPPPPAPAPWESLPTLSTGDRGPAVASLQRFLNRYDWRPALPLLPVTGNYLAQTTDVVRRAQAQCGIPLSSGADGRTVGPRTKQAFYARGWRG